MKAWIHPSWWWCNGVGAILLAHFGPLSTNWASFKHHSLPELCIVPEHVHPFMTQCTHLRMVTSSRIMHHVKKLKSSQTVFLNMTMSSLYSNCLQSHQISIKLNTFGMWWNRRFASWMSSQQIWCYHVNMDQNLWRIKEHLVESMPRRIKAVLKAKAGSTR